MSLEVSSRHVRILRTGERGGPRLSFMASELLRWLSALPQLSQAQAAHSPLAPHARRRVAAVLGPYQLQLVLKQCCLAKKLAKVQNIVEFINDSVLSSQRRSSFRRCPEQMHSIRFSRFFQSLFLGLFQSVLILIQVIVINRMSQTFLTNRISESLPVFVTLWNFVLK